MEITNQQFLQIVAKKQQSAASVNISSIQSTAESKTDTGSIVEEMLAKNAQATVYSIADEVAKNNSTSRTVLGKLDVSLVENFGHVDYVIPQVLNNSSDEILGSLPSDIVTEKKFAVSIEDMSPSKIADIKQIIYDLHFKSDETDPTDPTDPGTDTEEPDEPDEPKPSFIDEFDDVESMFDWMHEQDPTISKETGLTRAQLIKFTQNDNWEDSNYDFFGSLNRIFDILDKNSDDVLSVDEIKQLIGEEIGTSTSAYQSKVEVYANQLEAEYQSLDPQGKLEFAIEKTREYLVARGMTAQIEALDRLLSGTDTHNDIHVGQIAFAKLNPEGGTGGSYTLGAYSSMCLQFEYNGMNVSVFVSDYDTADFDGGLTLDEDYYLNSTWYELVDTLVHELTHATAYQNTHFSEDGYILTVSQEQLDTMYAKGALNESDYRYYSSNINRLIQEAIDRGEYNPAEGQSINFSDEKLARFYYLTYTMWGEYSAYQTDADYVDSIGGDIFDRGNMTTAVNGDQEKTVIENHIDSLYNSDSYTEAEPDWKWWTFA